MTLISAAGAPAPASTTDLVPILISTGGVVVAAIVAATVALIVAMIQRNAATQQAAKQLAEQREHADRQLASQREQMAIEWAGQREQFREQIAREHQKWRLESRSQSYIEFIVSVQRVRELIASFASMPLEIQTDGRIHTAVDLGEVRSLVSTFHARYDDAFKSGQLVRLHGPAEVRASAEKVISGLVYLRNTVDERLRSFELNLPSTGGQMWHESTKELHVAVEDFISIASSVIDSI